MPAGTSKLLACAGVALLFDERARRILLCWLEDGMRELAWRRLPRKRSRGGGGGGGGGGARKRRKSGDGGAALDIEIRFE